MSALKKISLIIHFYRSFWLLSTLITMVCMILLWEYGLSIFSTLLWFKLATLFIIYRFIASYKRKEFYYYQNLGISKKLLWISTIGVDIIVYLFLIYQTNRLR